MYAGFLKRIIDFVLSLLTIVVLSPVLLILTIIGAIKMKGNPFFTQKRPGLYEKIFRLIKFRTMTNEKDEKGNLLPDEERLIPYGRFLRSTSLDELPELFNILLGQMAIIGPRPQLVRDMVFMDQRTRQRHTVRPGLSGLAQVMGRNAISWEEKYKWDLKYIENITFRNDMKIIGLTLRKVLGHEESAEEIDVTDDYGDWLLKIGKINKTEYDRLQEEAKKLISEVKG